MDVFDVYIRVTVKVDQGINCQSHLLCRVCLSLCQWAAVGPPGPNGQSVMLGAGGAGSDERAAAPILPLWMEEPFVRAHPSREWPAPHCVQVKMTHSSVLFNIFRQSSYALEYQEISQMGHYAGSTSMNFKTSGAGFQLCKTPK